MTDRETATILAALRFWQRIGLQSRWSADNAKRGYRENESTQPEGQISTDQGRLPAMTREEIDALCERLNVG